MKDKIIKACKEVGLDHPEHWAYVLATVEHETAGTFKPVREAYWLRDPDGWLRRNHPEYYPYYGRGYVQITWKENYEKFGKLLGIDLVGNPDLALDPDNALFILVYGFKHGSFTGRTLERYVPGDFLHARRCINGMDRAEHIATIAKRYLNELI